MCSSLLFRRLSGLAVLAFTVSTAIAQPTFVNDPQSQSVSLGVDVILYTRAFGPTPVTYQWRKDGLPLPGETMEILALSPVQPSDAGDYDVIATDFTGSVTSLVAQITVDPTFTKITRDPVVNGAGGARGAAWADYDNDGFLDLFVAHDANVNNALYRNNRDGTFTQITDGPVVNNGGASYGGAWGDANNDGFPELHVANYSGQHDFLYLNNGNGTFSRITNGPAVSDGRDTFGSTWVDADNDGRLDLLTVNLPAFGSTSFVPGSSFLYHNYGDATFGLLPNSPGSEEANNPLGTFFTIPSWSDFDNDGRMDLLIGRFSVFGGPQSSALYRNLGSNQFARAQGGDLTSDRADAGGGAWGDYDNDGWPDVYVSNGINGTVQTNALYHNNGNGTFTRVTNGVITEYLGRGTGAAWGDYDNDGLLDLFVTDQATTNLLYHNSGDGTFTQVTTGSPVNDSGFSLGCAWADYDNNGFLDLLVSNEDQGNFLYRNNGNSNAWLEVTCVGRISNRAAIGTKVRVSAMIGGTNRWQLREITGGTTFASQALLAHFGLGDASQADLVRVEWPSGFVQELSSVAVRQPLGITEPPYSILPRDPGAIVGSEFTLSVGETAGTPVQVQWRFNGTDLADATNATLVFTNVQPGDLGSYSAIVRDPAGAWVVFTPPAVLRTAVLPSFVSQPQPTNLSVSLGVTVTYTATVAGTDPLTFQWQCDGVNLPGATSATLSLTNVQPAHAGRYTLLASNLAGVVTSQDLLLDVDPTFTKIVSGDAVTSGGASYGAAWVDVCDHPAGALFVANGLGQDNSLYRNQADGSLIPIASSSAGSIVSDGGDSTGVAVGDYDNDGRPDVFVANNTTRTNFLYHNDCGGVFSRVSSSGLDAVRTNFWGAAWADYNNDGFLDLYAAASGLGVLYRNNQNGTFTRITNSVLTAQGSQFRGCAWGDYDNDGDPDLFIANANQVNALLRNNGDGTFTRMTTSSIGTDRAVTWGGAWGDFNNDGHLDLCVAATGGCLLYRNNGDRTFTRITNSAVAALASARTCAWADYDNDGFLDLFVANVNGPSFLFRNNGDGTFARVSRGSIASDIGSATGCTWGDYDSDGFPDLFVSHYNLNNCLYRNNGNSHHWLKVKCVGVFSNRSAIGAKVRVEAVIGGAARWQLREITSGDGFGGHGLLALFGLGDAVRVGTLRIEWPSGIVQELRDLPADQFLTVTEPPRLSLPQIVNGQFQFQLVGAAGQGYTIETSPNLHDWTPWQTLTNVSSTQTVTYPGPANSGQLYFRAVTP